MKILARAVQDPLLFGESLTIPLYCLCKKVAELGREIKKMPLSKNGLKDLSIKIVKLILGIALTLLFGLVAFVGYSVKVVLILWGSSSKKRELLIEDLAKEAAKSDTVLLETIQEWLATAKEKKKSPRAEREQDIFHHLENSITSVHCHLTMGPLDSLYDRVLLCKDKSLGQIQALMLLQEIGNKQFSIKALAVNPRNIYSRVNKYEYTRVKRADAELIAFLRQQGSFLYMSEPEQEKAYVDFYLKKLGFVRAGKKNQSLTRYVGEEYYEFAN